MTKADRVLEALASSDEFEHDNKDTREMWNSLESVGCYDFVKTQIEDFKHSDYSSRLNRDYTSMLGFLRGSIYGFILGKTGDYQFAIKVSSFALDLVTKKKGK